MSARSSLHSAVALLVAVTASSACGGKKAASGPEGDPAKVAELAKRMVTNVPPPAGAKPCTIGDLMGTQLTMTTLLRLAQEPVPDKFEYQEFVNPPSLDAPAASVLLDPKSDDAARRSAAGTLLAGTPFIVIKTEMVNVPMALGVKEMKRGALGMRAIGYDTSGTPTCIHVFTVRNDKQLSEWAMDKSDKPVIDPAVAKALRDDLTVQLVKTIFEQKQP